MQTSFITTLIGAAALAAGVSAADGTCTKSGVSRIMESGDNVAASDRGTLCEKLFSNFDGQCSSYPDSTTTVSCDVAGDGLNGGKLVFTVSGDEADCSDEKIELVWWLSTNNDFGEVSCS